MNRLEWDSDFFGVEVYRVNLRDGDALSLNSLDADLVYLFDEGPEFVHSLQWQEQGIPLVDAKLTFKKNIEVSDPDTSNGIKNISEMSEKLLDLSFQSSVESRFRRDPKLEQKCNGLYTQWIGKSLSGEMATEVLGCFDGSELIGMITYLVQKDASKIGLIAVDKNYRGRGVGRRLLQEVENRSGALGAKTLEVVTQSENTPAVRFYENFGFKLNSEVRIHHYWKNEH